MTEYVVAELEIPRQLYMLHYLLLSFYPNFILFLDFLYLEVWDFELNKCRSDHLFGSEKFYA